MLEHMTLLEALERFDSEKLQPDRIEQPSISYVTSVHMLNAVIVQSPDALLSLRPASTFAQDGREECEPIEHDPSW